MVGIAFIIFLLFITSCSYSVDRNAKDEIEIKPLESIQKVNCNTDTLNKLDITKCEMEARLLELKY